MFIKPTWEVRAEMDDKCFAQSQRLSLAIQQGDRRWGTYKGSLIQSMRRTGKWSDRDIQLYVDMLVYDARNIRNRRNQ